MPVTLDQSEGMCRVCLQGELNISSAAELKNHLVRALASGTGLSVNLERVTEIDITTVQLLWAAEREATRSGVVFTLVGVVPDHISAALHEVGFESFLTSMASK